MNKFKHDILLRIVKSINIILITIPFAVCWFFYYADHVAVSYTHLDVYKRQGEYTVDASLCLRENARWAAKGHCVAFGQWHISRKAPEKPLSLIHIYVGRHRAFRKIALLFDSCSRFGHLLSKKFCTRAGICRASAHEMRVAAQAAGLRLL